MGNLIRLLICFSLAACGKGLPVADLRAVEREQVLQLSPADLVGEIETPAGDRVVISAERTKPLVLVFASDSCAVCTAETRAFVQHLGDQAAQDLANVDYYTILIGAYPEDVSAWIKRLAVSWTAGLEEDDGLFAKFCPEKLTPCIVTYNPINQRLAKFIGETALEKLQQETGPWSYLPTENH